MRAVNLIPAEERRGAGGIAGRSGGVVYVLTGGLAVLVVMGLIYAFAVHSVAQRKGQLAALTQQVSAVQAQSQELASYVEFAAIAAQQGQTAAALANQRFDWPDAMAQLALALPSDVTLTSFDATTSTAASASATPASATGPTFSLTGCASRQAEISDVLTKLAAVPGVSNVSLQTTNEEKRALGKVAPSASEDRAGACPYVNFQVAVTYSASYTVPSTEHRTSSADGAQTVSSSSGSKTSIIQTAKRRVTG
jgi:Tfp pilus assembly protein PilN